MSSSKPLPIFDQMPLEIKEKIVEYTDTWDKISLRQCCKYFKNIVDNSEFVYDRLDFRWHFKEKVTIVRVISMDDTRISKRFDDHLDSALEFLEAFFQRHSRIRLKALNVCLSYSYDTSEVYDDEEEYFECKERLREQLTRIFFRFQDKLSVSTLIMNSDRNGKDVMTILPYLEPGTLRSIRIMPTTSVYTELNLSEIAGTEQWKQATYLDIRFYADPGKLLLEKTAHFSIMNYLTPLLKLEDVKYILEKMMCENGWTYRAVHFDKSELDEINEYLSGFEIVDRVEKTFPSEHSKFTIHRGGYKCRITAGRDYGSMRFCGREKHIECYDCASLIPPN